MSRTAGHPTELPPAFTPTTIPAVAQVNGVYVVLQGVTPGAGAARNLMGGYGYLEWSGAGDAWHEGLDLNSLGPGDADLGAAVVAPLGGLVVAVRWWDQRSAGFGNHLALWIDDPRAASPCYLHLAHLDTVVVAPGQRVVAGQRLGAAGKSGRQPYAHVHLALWVRLPPQGWDFWQAGYSREWAASQTLDPQAWYWASVARAGAAGAAGGQPPPPEGLMLLSDWQIANWILPPLFTAAGIDYNPDAATSKAWVAELRAGRYRGRPRTGETPYGEGADVGLRVEWEGGVLLYRVSDGAVAWEG